MADQPSRAEILRQLSEEERKLESLSGAEKRNAEIRIRAYKSMLKELEGFNKEQEESVKRLEELKEATNDWGQALFGVNLGRFIEENKNYARELENIQNNISLAQLALTEFEDKTVNGFARLATYIQSDTVKIAELAEATNDLAQLDPGLAAKLDEAMADPNKIIGLWENMTEEQQKMLFETINKKDGLKDLANYFNPKNAKGPKLQEMKKGIADLRDEMENVAKYSFNFSEAFEKILKNIGESVGPQKLIRGLREFDNQLAGIKKEFQLPTDSFNSAKVAMDEMVQKGAQFGLSTADSFAMVKTLGDEARSTNVANLAATAKELAAIPAATGIASQQVAEIAGKMVRFGASSDQAKKAFDSISKQSLIFGVNVTKTSKIFADNLSKFQRAGFKEGEASLAKMAAKAEKVGFELGNVMEAADKFLDINTALEASADLSLLGGAASQVGFLDLMKAAQEGPDAMSKMVDSMVSDIGRLKKDGTLALDRVIDIPKLQKIAEATGETVESLQNRINARLQDQAKKAQFSPKMFDALSDEEKEFLLSKTVKDKTGKFKIEGMEGIKDLKEIGPTQIAAMKAKAEEDAKNAEKAAEARRSFDESITALSGSFIALVNGLQPILGALTTVINFFVDVIGKFTNFLSSNFSPGIAAFVKGSAALIIALGFSFGPMALARWTGGLFRALMSPLQTLSGIGTKLKDAFKGVGGKAAEKVSADLGGKKTDLTGGVQEPKKTGFLEQLKGISPAQILSIAAAIVALGIAFLLIGKGIQFASEGLAVLVKSFNDTKNAGMALAAVAIVMGGFVAMLAIMIPVIGALGAVATPVAIPLIALGVAFLLMGAGVALAAIGLAKLVESVGKMGKSVNNLFTAAAGIGALALSLYAISPALLFFGAAGLFAIPAMIALAAGLAIVSVSMKLITPVITALSSVKSDGISALGKNLLPLSLGLLSLVPVGLLSPFILAGAIAAVIASGAISILVKSLSSIKGLDPKIISSIASGLNTLFFPLMKFALVGLVSPALILAGAGLMAITKGLSYLKDIDLKNITVLPSALKSLVGSLFLFSTVGVVSGLLILSGIGLAAVTGALSLLKGFNVAGATALSNILPKLGAGLALFALAGIAAPYGILAAGVLIVVSKALQFIDGVDATKLTIIGNSLSNIGKGLVLFSLAGITAPLGILAATALTVVSKALLSIGNIDTKNLIGLGPILGPLGIGLIKFSAAGLFAPFAIIAAGALAIVSKAIGLIPNFDTKKLIDLGKTLPSIGMGLIKFSLAGIFAPLAILAGGALTIVSKALGLIGNIDTAKLNPIGNLLPSLGFGLIKFSLAGFTAGLSILAAGALLVVSKALALIGNIDATKLIPLGTLLPSLGFGLLKFSIAGITAPLSVLAAGALLLVSKALSLVGPIDPVKMITLSNILPSLGFGLMKFSISGIVAPLAVLAAGALLLITKSLSNLSGVNPVQLTALANSLPSIGLGIIKFSSAGLVAPLALVAAGSLFLITKALSLISVVDPVKLMSLGMSLPKIGLGLISFAAAGMFAPLAVLGALALIPITKALALTSTVDLKNTLFLSSILRSLGPAMMIFGLSGFLAPMAMLSASTLAVIAKAFSYFKGVDVAPLMSLGNVLKNVSGGILTFSAVGLLAGGAILGSISLIAIGKAMQIASQGFIVFATVPWASLAGVAPILQSLLSSFAKMGLLGVLAAPGMLAIAATLKILGASMSSVTNGFAASAKAMADFNLQIEKLKANSKGIETVNVAQLQKINEAATKAGPKPAGVAPVAVGTTAQSVKIAPIEINLKLNGRDLQQLIVEANYNRT